MKYEPVFGDQSLFDNAPLGTELVGHSGGFYKNSPDGPIYCGGCTFTTDEYRNIGFIAARRVIRTPTWTVEDQKAGRFPEVGCNVDTFTGECVVIGRDSNLKHVAVQYHDDGHMYTLHISKITPIESPEEKAQREEDEFVDSLRSVEIHGRTVGGYLNQGARAAYRKLKGGE